MLLNRSFSFRGDIQTLRGVAVLAVILFHVEDRYFPMGFLGVDIFFVISGFVVTPLIARIFEESTCEHEWRSSAKEFYKRRLFRLGPALIVTLIASLIVVLLFGPINDHRKFAKQGLATLLLAGNIGAYKDIGNYFSPNPNPLIHTWSLAVEEQIYFFLPIVTYIIFKRNGFSRLLLLKLLLSLSFLSLAISLLSSELQTLYSAIGIQSVTQYSFYSPIDRFWQFGVGGVLSLIPISRLHNRNIDVFTFKALIQVILLIILFLPFTFDSKISSIAVTFITLSIIATRSLTILPMKIRQCLDWLGDRSYSLYLIHMPLQYIAKYSEWLDWGMQGDRQLQSLVGFLLTFILGNALYVYVEMPFRLKKFGPVGVKFKLNRIMVGLLLTLLAYLSMFAIPVSDKLVDHNLPVVNEISPLEWAKKCKSQILTANQDMQSCLISVNGATKNFLLIGDSHARSLSNLIVEIGELNQANVYIQTLQACPLILNSDALDFEFRFPKFSKECIEHNKKVMNFLTSTQIDTIFYTQRSSVGYAIPRNILNTKLLISWVSEDLAYFGKLASKVFFIGITPEYLPINSVASKIIGKEGNFLKSPYIENSAWKLELQKRKINYIDVYPLFCKTGDECKNRLGGRWLFVDGDHLSKTGADFIKPLILKAMSEAE